MARRGRYIRLDSFDVVAVNLPNSADRAEAKCVVQLFKEALSSMGKFWFLFDVDPVDRHGSFGEIG